MKLRDFIGERGFNKLISPFQESIEKRGWNLFCKHKALGFHGCGEIILFKQGRNEE